MDGTPAWRTSGSRASRGDDLSMTATIPSSPPPALSMPEIAVHGLADGVAMIVLLSSLAEYLESNDLPYLLVNASLSLLVLLLSALVLARRMRPESRKLRAAEIVVSVLVAAVGAAAVVLTLAFMFSGATYRGESPDAGGMGVMFGLLLYFPSAGLLILPLAMKMSRLSRRLRRALGWSILLLVLLPFAVLTVARI